jgi:hypothetical protein
VADTNPFVFEDEGDENDPAGSENANFKQLRDYAKKLEREVTSAKKELTTLREFKVTAEASVRQAQVAEVFKGVGLADKHASLYLKVNPEGEVTLEAVEAFATEYELPRTEVTTDATPVPTTQTQGVEEGKIYNIQSETQTQAKPGFAPTQGTGAPSARVISEVAEAEKLMIENPQEYARLHQLGRIKLTRLPGSSESRLPGVS